MRHKVGIMGGTFNPVHIAHLILAEQCLEQFRLDNILFIPTGHPPHKDGDQVVEAVHRAAMVKLSIAGNPRFHYSDIEIQRNGYSYTTDTLQELHRLYPDTDFFFIMGADSLYYLEKWYEPQRILELATIVVANRDEHRKADLDERIRWLTEQFGGKILGLRVPSLDISSKYIRSQIAAGNSVRYYIVDEVRQYIEKHALYQL